MRQQEASHLTGSVLRCHFNCSELILLMASRIPQELRQGALAHASHVMNDVHFLHPLLYLRPQHEGDIVQRILLLSTLSLPLGNLPESDLNTLKPALSTSWMGCSISTANKILEPIKLWECKPIPPLCPCKLKEEFKHMISS